MKVSYVWCFVCLCLCLRLSSHLFWTPVHYCCTRTPVVHLSLQHTYECGVCWCVGVVMTCILDASLRLLFTFRCSIHTLWCVGTSPRHRVGLIICGRISHRVGLIIYIYVGVSATGLVSDHVHSRGAGDQVNMAAFFIYFFSVFLLCGRCLLHTSADNKVKGVCCCGGILVRSSLEPYSQYDNAVHVRWWCISYQNTWMKFKIYFTMFGFGSSIFEPTRAVEIFRFWFNVLLCCSVVQLLVASSLRLSSVSGQRLGYYRYSTGMYDFVFSSRGWGVTPFFFLSVSAVSLRPSSVFGETVRKKRFLDACRCIAFGSLGHSCAYATFCVQYRNWWLTEIFRNLRLSQTDLSFWQGVTYNFVWLPYHVIHIYICCWTYVRSHTNTHIRSTFDFFFWSSRDGATHENTHTHTHSLGLMMWCFFDRGRPCQTFTRSCNTSK